MRAHVIGAGLAGLSAGVRLAAAGVSVRIYESGAFAGGRCRSYFDHSLGLTIDNGNHLLLSGNHSTMSYVHLIGARETFRIRPNADFSFLDRITGERWTLRVNKGRFPWWIFAPSRRVPGTAWRDYLALLRLRTAKGTVAEALASAGALYRKLLEPLAVAALNTPPQCADARLLHAVVAESLAMGGDACLPLFPKNGLSESLIAPALQWLQARGSEVILNRRISELCIEAERVTSLTMADGTVVALAPDEAVVLAAPPWVSKDLLPRLVAPQEFQAILNIHFRLPEDAGEHDFIGIIGGFAEWVFVKTGVISVTISAANRWMDETAAELAGKVWPDVAAALNLPLEPIPPFRVVKEKRATFAATPEVAGQRPRAETPLSNLVLAGDWTMTGLPATVEGAIRSGETAAKQLLSKA